MNNIIQLVLFSITALSALSTIFSFYFTIKMKVKYLESEIETLKNKTLPDTVSLIRHSVDNIVHKIEKLHDTIICHDKSIAIMQKQSEMN